MTFSLNLDYAQPNENEQQYPALQADNYQPRLKDKVVICLNESSFMLLSDTAKELLAFDLLEGEFKGESVNLFKPTAEVRFVPLAMPKMFCFHKESSRYKTIAPGVKFKESGLITAGKIHLCAIVNNEILLTEDGNPQIFTLNLKSTKTQLIKTAKPAKGDGSLHSWNEQLKAEHKGRGWLLHMFGFKLAAVPKQFKSSISDDTSIGIMFEMNDPQVISPDNQKLMFECLKDETLKKSIANPYRIGEPEAVATTQLEASDAPEYTESDALAYIQESDASGSIPF